MRISRRLCLSSRLLQKMIFVFLVRRGRGEGGAAAECEKGGNLVFVSIFRPAISPAWVPTEGLQCH